MPLMTEPRYLEVFEADAKLPTQLALEPHEIAQAVRSAKGGGLYVLRAPEPVAAR